MSVTTDLQAASLSNAETQTGLIERGYPPEVATGIAQPVCHCGLLLLIEGTYEGNLTTWACPHETWAYGAEAR